MSNLELTTNEHTGPLSAAGYELRRGWNEQIASELVDLSLQPHITQMTPNDSASRFRSVEAATVWYDSHERVMYTLSHRAVAGLIWFGEAQSAHAPGDYTFAIRMYSAAQGQGLARPFMNAAHADFRRLQDYSGEIWLDTATTNDMAIALYKKAGYTPLQVVDGRLYMVQLP